MLKHEKPIKHKKNDETLLQKFRQNLALRTTSLFLEGVFLVTAPAVSKIARAQTGSVDKRVMENGEKRNVNALGFVEGVATRTEVMGFITKNYLNVVMDSVALIGEQKNKENLLFVCAEHLPNIFVFVGDTLCMVSDLQASSDDVNKNLHNQKNTPVVDPKNIATKLFVMPEGVKDENNPSIVFACAAENSPILKVLFMPFKRNSNDKLVPSGFLNGTCVSTEEISENEGGYKNLRLSITSNFVFIYGEKENGSAWDNLYVYNLANYILYKADAKEFIKGYIAEIVNIRGSPEAATSLILDLKIPEDKLPSRYRLVPTDQSATSK